MSFWLDCKEADAAKMAAEKPLNPVRVDPFLDSTRRNAHSFANPGVGIAKPIAERVAGPMHMFQPKAPIR